MEIATLARRIVDLAEDKQARDIVLLDIRSQSTLADYFVICSADNERQIRAIVESVSAGIVQEYDRKPRSEGPLGTGWVILDYDDIVVHVFTAAQREYYQLESLWHKATPVLVVQ